MVRNSNTGFVLLKHTTDTGEGRTITFYSLYMHLLDIDAIQRGFAPLPSNPPEVGSSTVVPRWLCYPTDGVMVPANLKVYRKDVLGHYGYCHGQPHLHFEIFMTEGDFAAWFEQTGHTVQLGNKNPATPESKDYWGHSYFVIPAGQSFVSVPPGLTGAATAYFPPLQAGTVEEGSKLYVEAYFHKGQRYTRSWLEKDGALTSLTGDQPVLDPYPHYEYQLYDRATALYPACPSDGYELLRFGRILSDQPTLPDAAQKTWVAVTFESGKQGYIDISQTEIQKLSDADFPFFMGWQKIAGANTPFSQDGLCDYDALRSIVNDVEAQETPHEQREMEVYKRDTRLAAYVCRNEKLRKTLRGFVCHAPSEWDASGNEARYKRLRDPDGFFGKRREIDPDGYDKFIRFQEQLQFVEKTPLGGGRKFWFFHPLAFIRHFRKCGWLTLPEIARCVRRTIKENGKEVGALTAADMRKRLMNAGQRRPAGLYPNFSSTMRRYGINGALRQAYFFGQVLQETGRLEFMVEGGNDSYFDKYEPETVLGKQLGNKEICDGKRFKGRGLIQLTGRDNYRNYGTYRQKSYMSDNEVGQIGLTAFDATDAGGYYWAWKQRYKYDENKKPIELGKRGINYWADQGSAILAQQNVTRCVNPGLAHFQLRHLYFEHAYFALNCAIICPADFKPID